MTFAFVLGHLIRARTSLQNWGWADGSKSEISSKAAWHKV